MQELRDLPKRMAGVESQILRTPRGRHATDFLRSGPNSWRRSKLGILRSWSELLAEMPSWESGEPELHAGALRRRDSAHSDDGRERSLNIFSCSRTFVASSPARSGRGFLDRRHVNGDRVLELPRTRPRARRPAGYPAAATVPITSRSRAAQTLARQTQSAQLIVLIRIGAREVEHALRRAAPSPSAAARSSAARYAASCDPVGQPDVQRAARLPHRIVVLLVHGKREDTGV